MTTRDLALHIMKAKVDTADKMMAKGIGARLIHMLRMQAHRKALVMAGKRHGLSVWRLSEPGFSATPALFSEQMARNGG